MESISDSLVEKVNANTNEVYLLLEDLTCTFPAQMRGKQ